jgi:hypothetical protein
MAASSSQVTPPPTPPSPSASFYDVSDDEEGEYNTITHTSSGKGVKLLFSKSKVRSLTPPKDVLLGLIADLSGLYPSDAFGKGQYPGLYCASAAKACPS